MRVIAPCVLAAALLACGASPSTGATAPKPAVSSTSSGPTSSDAYVPFPSPPELHVDADARVIDGEVPGAAGALAGVKPAFVECVRSAHDAAQDAKDDGLVTMTIEYDAQGDVTKVSTDESDVGDVLARCVRDHAYTMTLSGVKAAGSLRVRVRMRIETRSAAVTIAVAQAPEHPGVRPWIEAVRSRAEGCQADALVLDPHVGGDLAVTVDVSDGFASCQTEASTLDAALSKCIVSALGSTKPTFSGRARLKITLLPLSK